MSSGFTRRHALKGLLGLGATAALAACGATPTPQVIERIVEKEVTKIVEGTPQIVIETVVVQETVVVEKEVAAGEPITLRVSSWSGGIGDDKQIADVILKGFMDKHPNVTATYEPAPWGEYWTKIQTMAASGTVYDLYGQSVAYGWDHAMTDQQILEKLLALNLERAGA